MTDLRNAVRLVREHEANLMGLIDGMLVELDRVIASARGIKKAILSEREGAQSVILGLNEMEALERDWEEGQRLEADKQRRIGVDVFRRTTKLRDSLEAAHIEQDDIVKAVVVDILERAEELREDIGVNFFGVALGRLEELGRPSS